MGGVMTWDYPQTDFAVLNIIRRNSVSANGTCKALAAQWIVDHACGGSLANRVTKNGAVDPGAIRMVMQNFVAAWDDQEVRTDEFLLSRGLQHRMGSRDVSATRSIGVGRARREVTTVSHQAVPIDQTGGGNIALELANALRRVNGSYVQIDFDGASGGHATPAWIGQDACHYDPNLGEVWFERASDFCRWFEVFYRASYQGFPCRFTKA